MTMMMRANMVKTIINPILSVSSGNGAHAVDRGVPDTDGQSRIQSGGKVS